MVVWPVRDEREKNRVNLGVEIKGSVTKTLRDLGAPIFERSRAQAQVKLQVKLDGMILDQLIGLATIPPDNVQEEHAHRLRKRFKTT